MVQAYLAAALLMTALVAAADPIPRYRGLAFDIVFYFALGFLWPVFIAICILFYLRGDHP